MKNLIFVFVMCVAFSFTACNKKTPEVIPVENDSITVADSTIVKDSVVIDKAELKGETTPVK